MSQAENRKDPIDGCSTNLRTFEAGPCWRARGPSWRQQVGQALRLLACTTVFNIGPDCFLPSRHVGEAGGRGAGLGARSRWSARRRALRQRTLRDPYPGTSILQRAWTVVSGGWRCPKAPHGAQLSWPPADRQQFTGLSAVRRLMLKRSKLWRASRMGPLHRVWARPRDNACCLVRSSDGLRAAVRRWRSQPGRGPDYAVCRSSPPVGHYLRSVLPRCT